MDLCCREMHARGTMDPLVHCRRLRSRAYGVFAAADYTLVYLAGFEMSRLGKAKIEKRRYEDFVASTEQFVARWSASPHQRLCR